MAIFFYQIRNFSELGFKYKGIPYEQIKVYEHGENIKQIFRNVTNGEIIKGLDEYSEYSSYWALFEALDFWYCLEANGMSGCNSNSIFELIKGSDMTKLTNHKDRSNK